MKIQEMNEIANAALGKRFELPREIPRDQHRIVAKPASPHFIYLQDPMTGSVERRYMGPDGHLGATEQC